MTHYYNEWNPVAAEWLRGLILAGEIPAGEVDERSIEDVQAEDLQGFVQCHFFAGIGGWPLALRLAGWPADVPVWTGSCPCQPFSSAGKAGGVGDKRHLWPSFHRLISECRPSVVFGEQVESKDGRLWFAGVRVDLENLGYAVGAADLCAASVGARHIRQRLYWVADAERDGLPRRVQLRADAETVESPEVNRPEVWGARWKTGDGESPLPLLVDGVPADVAASEAFGNAIVPQVGAEFVKAYVEA